MFRAVLLTLVVTFAAMFGLAFLTNDPHSGSHPTIPAVMRLFDRMALSGYLEVGPENTGPELRRWVKPLRVRVVGVPQGVSPDDWLTEVKQVLGLYTGLPTLAITVDPPEAWPEGLQIPAVADDTLAILTLPSDRLVPIFDSGAYERTDPNNALARVVDALADPRNGCVLEGDRSAVLHRVTLTVRGTLGEGQRHTCLVEKLSLALGFSIAATEGSTIFAIEETESHLNAVARMAAALVYNPALKPGMTRDAALSAAKAVLVSKGVPAE